jgi:hypothetical protein
MEAGGEGVLEREGDAGSGVKLVELRVGRSVPLMLPAGVATLLGPAQMTPLAFMVSLKEK